MEDYPQVMNDAFQEAVASNPGGAGIFTDFDGTLSHIVEVPSDARPVDGAREILSELSERLGVVAIVSGRAAGELLEWLGPDVEIWGVHGAEHTVDGRVELTGAAADFAALIKRAHADLQTRLAKLEMPGTILEDKTVMLALHYRNASDPGAARKALLGLATEAAQKHDLVASEGRMVIELRPPVEFSKADVVRRRSAELELRAAAFIGDDTVDLPGYAALDELAKGGVATTRVGVRSPESPAQLLERADVVVDGPEGTLEWLRSLL